MPVTITLTYSTASTETGKTRITFHTEGARVTSKVFACEVIPSSATASVQSRFSHVCSTMELVEFPEDVPGSSCYFRVSDITIVLDTAQMAERVLDNMRADIAHLVTELNTLEALGEVYQTGTAVQTAAILTAATEIQFSADGTSWHATQTPADTYLRFRNSAVRGDFSTPVSVPFVPKRVSVDITGATPVLAEATPGRDYHLGTLTSLSVTSLPVSDTYSTAWFTAGQGFTLTLPAGTGRIGTTSYTAGSKYLLVFLNGTVETKTIS